MYSYCALASFTCVNEREQTTSYGYPFFSEQFLLGDIFSFPSTTYYLFYEKYSEVNHFLYSIFVFFFMFYVLSSMMWMYLGQVEKAKMQDREKLGEQDIVRLMKEKENSDLAVLALKEELDRMKINHAEDCLQLATRANNAKLELEERLKETENLLTESRNKARELEAISESEVHSWKKKEHKYHKFIGFQFQALRV